jgi:acyl carrier protein
LDIAKQFRNFIIDNFMLGRAPEDLTDDASLLEKGIIDSTGVLELVGFIEQTFGFTVEDEDLVPANLDSVQSLTAYVSRKMKK